MPSLAPEACSSQRKGSDPPVGPETHYQSRLYGGACCLVGLINFRPLTGLNKGYFLMSWSIETELLVPIRRFVQHLNPGPRRELDKGDSLWPTLCPQIGLAPNIEKISWFVISDYRHKILFLDTMALSFFLEGDGVGFHLLCCSLERTRLEQTRNWDIFG